MQNPDLEIFTIFTVGHGNRTIDELIGMLKIHDVDILVDVRSIPYSRFHPQFRQSSLIGSLNGVGIKYLWLGRELGGRPSDPSLYCDGKVNYEKIKQTDLFKEGIRHVFDLVKGNIKVTLICSESDHNTCHRKHLIADELAELGLIVLHINKIGTVEQHVNTNCRSLLS